MNGTVCFLERLLPLLDVYRPCLLRIILYRREYYTAELKAYTLLYISSLFWGFLFVCLFGRLVKACVGAIKCPVMRVSGGYVHMLPELIIGLPKAMKDGRWKGVVLSLAWKSTVASMDRFQGPGKASVN